MDEEVEAVEEETQEQEVQELEEVQEQEVQEESEEDKKRKYQSKVDKRFAKMTADKYANERRIAELEAELKVTQQYAQPQQAQELPIGPSPPREPQGPNGELIEAWTEWKVTKSLEARDTRVKAQTKKQTQAQEAQELQNNFVENTKSAMIKYNDYIDATEDLNITIDSELGQNILESGEQATDIMYFLGKNPAEADKLSAMSGRKLSRAIGKLEVKLAAPTKKKTTKAPPPINSDRTHKTTGKVDLKTANDDAFYNEFMKKLHG